MVFWIWQNPISRIGYHRFGFTVYSAIPYPYFDLKIYSDGFPVIREKTHFISFDEVEDLIQEEPDFLLIRVGYDRMVKIDDRIFQHHIPLEVLDSERAIKRFNELKDEGRRVVMILHSTC